MRIGSILTVAIVCSGMTVASAAPVLQYTFDNIAIPGVSTGSNGTGLYRYATSNGQGSNAGQSNVPLGAAGSGVSGTVGDRALDLTSATGMGQTLPTPTNATYVRNDVDVDAIDATGSTFSTTLSGWFKTDGTEKITTNARLFENQGPGGFRFFANSDGSLLVRNQAGTNVAGGSSITLNQTNTWVFFAFTYTTDGTTATARIFAGDKTTAVTQVGSTNTSAPVLTADNAKLEVGYSSLSANPFDGYLDNLRVYASAVDSSGALSGANLEALRAADIVPEPSTAAIVGVSLLSLGIARRRRDR